MVPENIYTPPMEGYWKFQRGSGVFKVVPYSFMTVRDDGTSFSNLCALT